MPTVAAPVIEWEMQNWVELGGGNSGIVGDANHDTGFHVGARYLSSRDYSRRRDPNGSDGPYVDWDYACAGDFSHKNRESLRKHHRRVLNGLMNGQYPMICEFIGKPWADRPVYYWARWNGVKTLQRYTGSGHTHWSHISWWRSEVDKRANLWTPGGDEMWLPGKGDKGPEVAYWQIMLQQAGYKLPKFGNDGDFGDETVSALNAFRKDRGWNPSNRITPWTAVRLQEKVFQGARGPAGKDGAPGKQGPPGKDGKDGTLPAEINIVGTATVSGT